MNTDVSLLKLFEFEYWANRAALESIVSAGATARTSKLMSHIVGAQSVWLSRLVGEEPPLAVWPELDLTECGKWLVALRLGWESYFSGPDDLLDVPVAYRNTQGIAFETPPREILMHVVLHGQYHRGQIAGAIKADGGTPAVTDYIAYVRR